MRAQRIGRVLRKAQMDKYTLRDAKSAVGAVQKLLGKNGEHWIKEALKEGENYCLLGAIRQVVNENALTRDTSDVVFTSIKAAIPGINASIVEQFWDMDDDVMDYNDKMEREFRSIKEVLKRAKKAIGFAISGEKR